MLGRLLYKTNQTLCRSVLLSQQKCAHTALSGTADQNPYQLDDSQIKEAIQINPSLGPFSLDLWKRTHETFVNHGLETSKFLRIVTAHPAILRRTPERIINSLEQWRGCQFGESNVHLLITKYPEMLDVDDSQRLHKHITFLKSQFQTQKNIWKILMNSPDLIEQSEQTIKDKMHYLTQVMRIEIPEIVKSCALSRSLDEIRTRHTFQFRLGLFTPRKPKADPLTKSTNDRLYKITDTSEKTFAQKVCHATLNEYEAFKELYKRELSNAKHLEETEDFEEDDDESDNEHAVSIK